MRMQPQEQEVAVALGPDALEPLSEVDQARLEALIERGDRKIALEARRLRSRRAVQRGECEGLPSCPSFVVVEFEEPVPAHLGWRLCLAYERAGWSRVDLVRSNALQLQRKVS